MLPLSPSNSTPFVEMCVKFCSMWTKKVLSNRMYIWLDKTKWNTQVWNKVQRITLSYKSYSTYSMYKDVLSIYFFLYFFNYKCFIIKNSSSLSRFIVLLVTNSMSLLPSSFLQYNGLRFGIAYVLRSCSCLRSFRSSFGPCLFPPSVLVCFLHLP